MIFSIFAIIAYTAALLWITPTLANIKAVFSIDLLAVACHFISTSQELFLSEGQNFTLANVNALMSLLLSAFATFTLLKWRTIWFPLMIVYTFGI